MGRTVDQEFTPQNELEEKLQACQVHRVHWPTFVMKLLSSQIVVLLDGEVTPEQTSLPNPLTLATSDGFDVVALFTCADRATWLAQKFPQFNYGLLVEARWLLARINPEQGIVFNPGWSVGLQMTPSGFAKFKKDFDLE